MKIVFLSIGTRGDMEPFLAIGELLKEKGCRIICAFPEQFRDLAVDSGLEFASLGSSYIESLESDVGKAAMGGSGSGMRKLVALVKLGLKQKEINRELIIKQHEIIEGEKPERIVYNGKAIYPILWGIKNEGKNTLLSPVPYLHYVKGHTHMAFNSNFGPFLNKMTFSLADSGLITTARISARWLKMSGTKSRKRIKKALYTARVIYAISPSLFPRPEDWDENLKVLGYQERNKKIHWQPDRELTDYLEKHDRILIITFGSMINPDPEKKTRILMEVLEKNGIPAIMNTAAGGLTRPEKFNTELFHFVSGIPYDWIFPRIYGVIHHGGSGTTHLALRYGCASMIIPHILDQYVWNRLIFTIGAGPKGIRINRITAKNLEPKILELMNNPSYKRKAGQLADRMEKENFQEEIYKSITG